MEFVGYSKNSHVYEAKVINGRENSLDYPFSTTQTTDIENKNTLDRKSVV